MRVSYNFMTVLFITAMACGGSDSKGTDGGSNNQNSTGRSASNGGRCQNSDDWCPAMSQCMDSKCGTQAKACYGNGYASGNFSGGVCKTLIDCTLKCPCDTTSSTCEQSCGMQILTDQACFTCATSLGVCLEQNCPDSLCTGGSTTTKQDAAISITPIKLDAGTSPLPGLLDAGIINPLPTLLDSGIFSTTPGPNCKAATDCCSAIVKAGGANATAYAFVCASLPLAGEAGCLEFVTEQKASGTCK